MNKKILVGSVFVIILMLSMPFISTIHAQQSEKECNICPIIKTDCETPLLCWAIFILGNIFLLIPIVRLLAIPLNNLFWELECEQVIFS